MHPQALGFDPYFGIVVLGVVSAGFIITMLLLASFLGPKNPTKTKQIPFECGSVIVGDVKNTRFNIRFYLVCLLFILFDVEVIFMYPWAVNLRELGWFGLVQMIIFMLIIAVGFFYEWRRGVLDWNSTQD